MVDLTGAPIPVVTPAATIPVTSSATTTPVTSPAPIVITQTISVQPDWLIPVVVVLAVLCFILLVIVIILLCYFRCCKEDETEYATFTDYQQTSTKVCAALLNFLEPARWLSGNAFVSGAGGPKFKSRFDQTGHSVANGLPPLQHFFERSCVAWAQ